LCANVVTDDEAINWRATSAKRSNRIAVSGQIKVIVVREMRRWSTPNEDPFIGDVVGKPAGGRVATLVRGCNRSATSIHMPTAKTARTGRMTASTGMRARQRRGIITP